MVPGQAERRWPVNATHTTEGAPSGALPERTQDVAQKLALIAAVLELDDECAALLAGIVQALRRYQERKTPVSQWVRGMFARLADLDTAEVKR